MNSVILPWRIKDKNISTVDNETKPKNPVILDFIHKFDKNIRFTYDLFENTTPHKTVVGSEARMELSRPGSRNWKFFLLSSNLSFMKVLMIINFQK